ncbi:MAG TPA: CpsD/CapB family tyrosine-protein kinase, partial [Phycisphaerae bacterium]|nr:CpsD/CapB family tyrosine-protein kinase [Phycisphaerae bacterium]
MGDLAKQIAQITDQLKRKQDMERQFSDRIQALATEQKAPGRISVASPAVPVSSAHKDKRFMLSVMSMAGALFCGVVFAHLRGNVNPKVFIADDVQRTARVPFLGQLPHSPSAGTLLNDPNLLLQECMRMVRTALLERLDSGGERAVMITSASSSAGKTTVAIELAKSLAHLGKRTLLVEADLRRPTLAKRLGINNEEGLCALLSGEADQDAVITPSGVPHLDLIFAGRRPPVLNPELLANGVFTANLEHWKKQYDFVLLDCPPILPVADARILARQVDGAIMVSRSSHCRRSDVIQACADLSAAGGPLLGSVLVGVQPGSGYGYRYDYSYSYEATT